MLHKPKKASKKKNWTKLKTISEKKMRTGRDASSKKMRWFAAADKRGKVEKGSIRWCSPGGAKKKKREMKQYRVFLQEDLQKKPAATS